MKHNGTQIMFLSLLILRAMVLTLMIRESKTECSPRESACVSGLLGLVLIYGGKNETLRNFIRQTAEERREKIKSDDVRIASLSELIGIPQTRSNEEIIQHIRIDKNLS
jgi:hypothetical protein